MLFATATRSVKGGTRSATGRRAAPPAPSVGVRQPWPVATVAWRWPRGDSEKPAGLPSHWQCSHKITWRQAGPTRRGASSGPPAAWRRAPLRHPTPAPRRARSPPNASAPRTRPLADGPGPTPNGNRRRLRRRAAAAEARRLLLLAAVLRCRWEEEGVLTWEAKQNLQRVWWRSTGELGRCAGCGVHPRVAGGTGSRTGPTRTSGGTTAAGGTGPTNNTPRKRRASRRHGGGAALSGGPLDRQDLPAS